MAASDRARAGGFCSHALLINPLANAAYAHALVVASRFLSSPSGGPTALSFASACLFATGLLLVVRERKAVRGALQGLLRRSAPPRKKGAASPRAPPPGRTFRHLAVDSALLAAATICQGASLKYAGALRYSLCLLAAPWAADAQAMLQPCFSPRKAKEDRPRRARGARPATTAFAALCVAVLVLSAPAQGRPEGEAQARRSDSFDVGYGVLCAVLGVHIEGRRRKLEARTLRAGGGDWGAFFGLASLLGGLLACLLDLALSASSGGETAAAGWIPSVLLYIYFSEFVVLLQRKAERLNRALGDIATTSAVAGALKRLIPSGIRTLSVLLLQPHGLSALEYVSVLGLGALTAHRKMQPHALRRESKTSLLPTYIPAVKRSSIPRRLATILSHILRNPKTSRLLTFLVINLVFMFVELLYGLWANSLGLISDAGHMMMDCTALAVGLAATYVATFPKDLTFTYGYSRFEVVSGYTNSILLLFVALFIFIESLGRLTNPPNIEGDKLVMVSVAGLVINLVGLIFFHDHAHAHGGCSHSQHSHAHSHSHSHGTHCKAHASSSSKGSLAIRGVFLHILADTLGSLGVIVSSYMVNRWGWKIADPICSLAISLLILLSVVPLLQESTQILLQRVPENQQKQIESVVNQLTRLPGVVSYRELHCWSIGGSTKGEKSLHLTLHLQVEEKVKAADTLVAAQTVFDDAGIRSMDLTVQIEKANFLTKIDPILLSDVHHYNPVKDMPSVATKNMDLQ